MPMHTAVAGGPGCGGVADGADQAGHRRDARGAEDQGRPRQLRNCRAIGVHPFRQAADGRSGQDRPDRPFRGAAKRAVPDRGSGVGLPARGEQGREQDRGGAGGDQGRPARRTQRGGRGRWPLYRDRRCGADGPLQRVPIQLRGREGLLAADRHRSADDEPDLHRAEQGFQPKHPHRRHDLHG